MGYYTYFSLDYERADDKTFYRLVEEMSALYVTKYAFEINVACESFEPINCVKWYGWENDMRTVSANIPGVLITLHGEGESPEDMWNAYFLDGKMQYCPAHIIYDEYDPSKLS